LAAAEADADLIGFVFAPSRRRIHHEAAKAITTVVSNIGKVGVFVNAPLTEVQAIAQYCRLDFIQLAGDESPEYCAQLGYPVIKTIRIPPDGMLPDLNSYHTVAWLLFDTFVAGSYGGTGQIFDWRQIVGIQAKLNIPVMIAGGLTPDNVGEAIRQAAPQGVDVSGGVETDGQKDTRKIACFTKAVRGMANG
jgi:phosphoribosylanthranilate isomerase